MVCDYVFVIKFLDTELINRWTETKANLSSSLSIKSSV
jgi:hypothetical protein